MKYGDLAGNIVIWGKPFELEIERGQFAATIQNGSILVSCPEDRDATTFLENRIQDALRTAIRPLADNLCRKFGVDYEEIHLRKQRTKWASCSGNKILNFNIRCAFLPISHLYYLVTHEVAHLSRPDHDNRFWELVESMVPEYSEYREELKGFWYLSHRNVFWKRILKTSP